LPRVLSGTNELRALLACVVIVGCHRPASHVSGASVVIPSTGPDIPPPPPRTAHASRIPRDAARFEIEVVSDSTARFKPREVTWIRVGMTAYIVDPTNRDALVARSRVISVWNDMAVAVVTSQVTRVTPRHVVLMTPPRVPWWRAGRFWVGAMVGALVGGSIGVVATP
jgi:hypothetical protein